MKVVGTTKIVDYKVVDYKTGQRRMCLSNKLAKGEHSPLESPLESPGENQVSIALLTSTRCFIQ